MKGLIVIDSTKRFSDRVDDYTRYRPTYPVEIVRWLKENFGLKPDHIVADVGSGTGISSELFLQNGNTVYGVEPNHEMRKQAESALSSYKRFHSINGSSNATTLPADFADFIVVAQAFHWFEPISTRAEFKRILKTGGAVAILFNDRKTSGSDFSVQYEELLNEFGSDYKQVKHKNVGEKRHREFLGDFQEFHFPTYQEFDFDGLLGRLRSSSYAPKEGHPKFPAMVSTLRQIFDQNNHQGVIRMEYDSQVFCARFN